MHEKNHIPPRPHFFIGTCNLLLAQSDSPDMQENLSSSPLMMFGGKSYEDSKNETTENAATHAAQERRSTEPANNVNNAEAAQRGSIPQIAEKNPGLLAAEKHQLTLDHFWTALDNYPDAKCLIISQHNNEPVIVSSEAISRSTSYTESENNQKIIDVLRNLIPTGVADNTFDELLSPTVTGADAMPLSAQQLQEILWRNETINLPSSGEEAQIPSNFAVDKSITKKWTEAWETEPRRKVPGNNIPIPPNLIATRSTKKSIPIWIRNWQTAIKTSSEEETLPPSDPTANTTTQPPPSTWARAWEAGGATSAQRTKIASNLVANKTVQQIKEQLSESSNAKESSEK